MPAKILIVDDSELVGSRVAELLLAVEHIILLPQVVTIKEALASCAANNPDIIFLDFHLTNGNGIDLVTTLRKNSPGIKIVMFTNTTGEYYIKKFKEAGGDVFLDKTKDFEKIADVVTLLLKR